MIPTRHLPISCIEKNPNPDLAARWASYTSMHAVNNLSTCTDRGAGWSRDTHGTTPTYERSNAQARPRDEPGADRTRGTDRILRPTQINNLTFLLFFPSWRLGRGHRPRACCPRALGGPERRLFQTFCKRSPAAPSFGATWSHRAAVWLLPRR